MCWSPFVYRHNHLIGRYQRNVVQEAPDEFLGHLVHSGQKVLETALAEFGEDEEVAFLLPSIVGPDDVWVLWQLQCRLGLFQSSGSLS